MIFDDAETNRLWMKDMQWKRQCIGGLWDEAEWHFPWLPQNVDLCCAYTHAGMYLGWLADHGLTSEYCNLCNENELDEFKMRAITPQNFFVSVEGKIATRDLNELGDAFTSICFLPRLGQVSFWSDYKSTFVSERLSFYEVADTWENYKLLCDKLNQRLSEFSNCHSL
ncbi:MAG TPA: hypothetical protein V6C76_18130 [Drouetiella sp.]